MSPTVNLSEPAFKTYFQPVRRDAGAPRVVGVMDNKVVRFAGEMRECWMGGGDGRGRDILTANTWTSRTGRFFHVHDQKKHSAVLLSVTRTPLGPNPDPDN